MGVVSFPSVASGLSTEQLADLVARMIKEVEWLANGNMDSANIRNIAGFDVNLTTLMHSSGIVGMDGSNPKTATAVRFWSGHANPALAPFRVQQDGTLFATNGNFTGTITGSNIYGSYISTANGTYPRTEMSTTGNQFGAYQAADKFVKMDPSANASSPGFNFQNTAGHTGLLYMSPTDFAFLTPGGSANIQITSGLDLLLSASNALKLSGASLTIDNTAGFTGSFTVITGVNFVASTTTSKTVTVTKGIVTSVV